MGEARMEISLLGPVSARRGGRALALGTPRQRTVMAVLAAHANRVVVRDDLVQAVWGHRAPVTAMNSVYTYIARLRKALEPERSAPGRPEVLVSDGAGYAVRIPPDQVDRQRFEAHLAAARQLYGEDAAAAVERLDAALGLWNGGAYAGLSGAFVDADRARLDDLRFTAVADRIELLQHLGRHTGLVATLSALVRQYPLQERLRFLLIRGYVQQGRQADAIGEYHDLRQQLIEAQGIEPGERLREQYAEVLRADRSTVVVPGRAAAVPGVRPQRWVAVAQLARDVPGFVGRAAELDHLTRLAVRGSESGEATVVHVCGGPGVGKSALAVRLAHRVARHFPDGQVQIDLQGLGGGRPLPPHRALGRLLTALGAAAAAAADLDEQVAHYRSVVAGRRVLVLLDDAVSAEQVRPLLPGARSTLVITTSRNGFAGLVARDGAHRVRLRGLEPDEAVPLFAQVLDRPVPAAELPQVRRLVQACGGVPLAVRIAAIRAAAHGAGALHRSGGSVITQLDVAADEGCSLRSAYSPSVRALSDEAATTFRALGTLPRRMVTTTAVVSAVTGMAAVVAQAALEELVDASLVQQPVHGHFHLDRLTHAYAEWLAGSTGWSTTAEAVRAAAELSLVAPRGRERGAPAG